jgi:hypothetical protein
MCALPCLTSWHYHLCVTLLKKRPQHKGAGQKKGKPKRRSSRGGTTVDSSPEARPKKRRKKRSSSTDDEDDTYYSDIKAKLNSFARLAVKDVTPATPLPPPPPTACPTASPTPHSH